MGIVRTPPTPTDTNIQPIPPLSTVGSTNRSNNKQHRHRLQKKIPMIPIPVCVGKCMSLACTCVRSCHWICPCVETHTNPPSLEQAGTRTTALPSRNLDRAPGPDRARATLSTGRANRLMTQWAQYLPWSWTRDPPDTREARAPSDWAPPGKYQPHAHKTTVHQPWGGNRRAPGPQSLCRETAYRGKGDNELPIPPPAVHFKTLIGGTVQEQRALKSCKQELQHGQLIALWLKLKCGQLVRSRCRAGP